MAARPILSALAIFILAGGCLLQFFIILSGVISSIPIGLVYFLQVDTGGISGSKPVPNPARWTYFAICGVVGGHNGKCGKIGAAIPFDPIKNFGTKMNVPEMLVHKEKLFYYLSRVAWSFYIIALVFAVIALLLSIFALCSRLAAKFDGMMTALAALFQAVAAALMTAWTIIARKAINKSGGSAKLGTYAYAFSWAAFACFLIATILFCIGGGKDKSSSSSSKGGYFGRKRSTKSNRGSFRDSESGRRVKDEYD